MAFGIEKDWAESTKGSLQDSKWAEHASQSGTNGNNANDDALGALGGGVGSGFGGGWSSGPTQGQKDAVANLGGITNFNQATILGAAENSDKAFDIADQQSAYDRKLQTMQAKRNAGNDWYTQQQRLQSVTANLRESMGNALLGSTLYDLWDLLARKDDMDDVEVLNNMRENINNIDNTYFEAIMANNNSRNESYLDTEQNLRQLVSDYAAQVNNIHPDLAKDLISKAKEDEGGGINPPSWLQTSYFDEHVRDAIQPDEVSLFRPDTAATDAWADNLLTGQRDSSSATNQSYWDKLFGGYNRRSQ